MDSKTRTWIAVALGTLLLLAVLLAVGAYMAVVRFGVTRPMDNIFGDQH